MADSSGPRGPYRTGAVLTKSVFPDPDRRRDDWRDRGSCLDADPEMWFADPKETKAAAIAVCVGCPVRQQCFDWADRTGQAWGIWGGVDMSRIPQRRALPSA